MNLGNFLIIAIFGISLELYYYIKRRRNINREFASKDLRVLSIAKNKIASHKLAIEHLKSEGYIDKESHRIFNIYDIKLSSGEHKYCIEYRNGDLKRRYAYLDTIKHLAN